MMPHRPDPGFYVFLIGILLLFLLISLHLASPANG